MYTFSHLHAEFCNIEPPNEAWTLEYVAYICSTAAIDSAASYQDAPHIMKYGIPFLYEKYITLEYVYIISCLAQEIKQC